MELEKKIDSTIIESNFTFIDFLFTLVIQFGFQGFIESDWFKYNRMPTSSEITTIFVFFLALITVILSWHGYHQSISKKPHKNSLPEMFRFIIDVLLLLFYGIMLNKYDNPRFDLFMLFLVFLLYVLWDILGIIDNIQLKTNEKKTFKKYRRQLVSVLCCVLIFLVYNLNSVLNITMQIVLAGIIVFTYRILKMIVGIPK